jgi:predicted sulfurtransferase
VRAISRELKGTILLAEEGINCFWLATLMRFVVS